MKKLLKILFGAVILFSISTNTARAQDFFPAVNSDGDTLYYYITSSTSPYTVEVFSGSGQYYSGSINIPSTVSHSGTTYNVTSIGGHAFHGFSGLTSITIPNSVTSIGEYAFSGCSGLTSVTIGNSVTSIGEYTFFCCSSLDSIIIPNSVTSIGKDAFRGCIGLTAINVDNANTRYSSLNGVLYSKLQDTLVYCPARRYGLFTIPNSVTSIYGYAFANCYGLTSITIPNSVTSIGKDAFWGCGGLTAINVDNANTRYSSLNGVLYSKLQDTLVCCPAGKHGGFIIPNSVTSIYGRAFADCTGLTSITIPNSVTSIGEDAFAYCYGLTSVTIPNSVTSIGNFAFADCYGLTSVIIPNSVTSIDTGAFINCTGLTSIINMRTAPQSIVIGTNSSFQYVSSTIPVYVPCSSVSTYQNSDWGTTFSNIRGFSYDTTIVAHINQGETYTLNGFNADSTGVYVNATENEGGCYDLKILYLTVGNDVSSIYEINNNTTNNLSVKVYPNPANDKVNITINGLNEKASLFVYDIQGRMIRKTMVNANQNNITLDVSSLCKGVYNIKIVNSRNNISKRLILQ
ncbi:MAG: leucine-rich repeat protein [Bacteroidales bacterium]|jgi:hypothetical protein|nr:leucine-rich repeat protein [Bacteroidales bacterium]